MKSIIGLIEVSERELVDVDGGDLWRDAGAFGLRVALELNGLMGPELRGYPGIFRHRKLLPVQEA